ncbi:MAG: sulfotransferase family protein [Candidatus Thermoplasmatota archaeon]
MSEKKQKVFCIGLSKTATTSLTSALKILGYKSNHFPMSLLKYTDEGLKFDFSGAEKYDALSDLPVVRFYKELDRTFPDSKFILTTRELEEWLDSCRRHFWPGQILKGDFWFNRLHKEIYGAIDYDEEKFRKAYKDHRQEVLSYFSKREEDLLIMDITDGEGWEKLCPFLNEQIPDKDFPKKDCLYSQIFKIFNIQQFR